MLNDVVEGNKRRIHECIDSRLFYDHFIKGDEIESETLGWDILGNRSASSVDASVMIFSSSSAEATARNHTTHSYSGIDQETEEREKRLAGLYRPLKEREREKTVGPVQSHVRSRLNKGLDL